MNYRRQIFISHGLKILAGLLLVIACIISAIGTCYFSSINNKLDRTTKMESYGNYLGAYDLYMEVYGVVGDWKGVYNMAEELKERYEEQEHQSTTETRIIYGYPGPKSRFGGCR